MARREGAIVGCVRVQRLDDYRGKFGMLAANPAQRGTGVGRALLRFAEELSAARGLRMMQLELLVWHRSTVLPSLHSRPTLTIDDFDAISDEFWARSDYDRD